MATDDIWPAVGALATTWSASPVVDDFLARHPARNDSDNVVTEALRNLQASNGVLTQTPLWTRNWEQLAEQTPFIEPIEEIRSYFRRIAVLGYALESTVWWVRSRLALYPAIPVPQLSPRGYRRSLEFSLRVPWSQQALQAGLHDDPVPPGVAELLGLDSQQLRSSSANVLSALSGSAEWQRYADLAAALTDPDREALTDARNRVGVLLNPRLVSQYEEARVFRRNAFRREMVAQVVAGLDGRPRELADAFDVIDDLIDCALVNIHGQFVVRGDVPLIEPVDIELQGSTVSFDYDGDDAFGVGESVRLNDALATGVYRIDGSHSRFAEFEGERTSFTARKLPGSHNAFRDR